MVQLLERHADISTKARVLRDSVVHRAVRCRSKSRALPAALLQHADLSADEAQRVIRHLAAVSAACGPVPDDFDFSRRDHGLADALVTAAMRAVRSAQDAEARVILDGIGIRRLRLHHFSSHWPNANEIVRFLLAAAVRAALENRAPCLMDVAPEEVHSGVRLRKRSPSSKEYEAAVQRLLTEPRQGPPPRRKPRKATFSSREREEAVRTLEHRIRPLLPFVSAATQLLRTDDVDAGVAGTLERLTAVVSAATTYPYRDGPHYIATAAFGVTLGGADALGGLSAANGSRLVDWLVSSPIRYAGLWIDVVSVLSRRRETHPAALVLAEHTDTLLRSDTNIRDRITANGALARAIWRTSRAEAQAYFRRGLDIADAIGSDDYSRATDLVEFAANYGGPPLEPETVHTFARICELTIYDADKFPWTNFGEALARLAGAPALAIVARLADREKASLGLSLSPLLTSLVRHKRLDAGFAVALIGLDDPVETWSWSLADFARMALPEVVPAARETALRFLLCEIDRRYRGTPPRETLQDLLAVCRAQLSTQSPTLRHLEVLVSSRETRDASGTENTKNPTLRVSEPDAWEERATTVDPFDSVAIDAALASDEADKIGRWSVRFLSKLQDRVSTVDDRLRFLRAVAETRVPSLADKLLALEDQVKLWQGQSAAIADLIPQLALDLSLRHAEQLVGTEWESSYSLRKLIEFSRRPAIDIISAVIEALRARAIDVSGAAWMEFACVAARSASADAIRSAIERFTSMSALDLPDEVGDGSWRADLAAPAAPVDVVAGLLWLRLGSPIAAERWRAAHAVRRLADLGRPDVIQALVPHFTTEHAGSFQDHRLPFFFLHARLWLLIVLARIAKDDPESVLPFRSLLEGIAFNDAAPHVAMQHFAAQALGVLLERTPATDATSLRARLERVNASPFPPAEEGKPRRDFYHSSRSEGEPEPENPFNFEYEFSKGEIDGLGSVFGSDHQEVVKLATVWLRKWSKDVKNMWQCPRRPNADHDWSGSGEPPRDTWGGHLAWHSLMLSAGELLRTRPVVASSYRDKPWREWLHDHTLSREDGFWLADATDPFPPELYARMASGTGEDVPADPLDLAWLVGLKRDPTLAEELTIDGWWKSADGLDVSVDSVLVDATLAESVAFTVLTVDPFDRWFPRESDLPRRYRRRIPLRRLFREPEDRERKLDGQDPYAAPTALKRPTLARSTTKILGLRAADPFRRRWTNQFDIDVFRGHAWGSLKEDRYEGGNRSGNRLGARVDSLLAFLTSTRKRLVLLLKAQKYLKDQSRTSTRRERRGQRYIPFRTQTLVAIVCAQNGVRIVRRIPKRVRQAVNQVPDTERHEFGARLQAIERIRSTK